MSDIDSDGAISNVSVVLACLGAIEAGATGDALARFYTEDATQVEWPNLLNPKGGRSDLATLLLRAEQGKQVLRSQNFGVLSAIEQGDRVAVEAAWTGMLAIALGTLPAGAEMTAHFAMFFEMRDRRIAHQRNYDCF